MRERSKSISAQIERNTEKWKEFVNGREALEGHFVNGGKLLPVMINGKTLIALSDGSGISFVDLHGNDVDVADYYVFSSPAELLRFSGELNEEPLADNQDVFRHFILLGKSPIPGGLKEKMSSENGEMTEKMILGNIIFKDGEVKFVYPDGDMIVIGEEEKGRLYLGKGFELMNADNLEKNSAFLTRLNEELRKVNIRGFELETIEVDTIIAKLKQDSSLFVGDVIAARMNDRKNREKSDALLLADQPDRVTRLHMKLMIEISGIKLADRSRSN